MRNVGRERSSELNPSLRARDHTEYPRLHKSDNRKLCLSNSSLIDELVLLINQLIPQC